MGANGLSSWVIKEIAVYATGKCYECMFCSAAYCILANNFLSTKDLEYEWRSFAANDIGNDDENIGMRMKALYEEHPCEYFGTLFGSDIQQYVCKKCLPDRLRYVSQSRIESCPEWRARYDEEFMEIVWEQPSDKPKPNRRVWSMYSVHPALYL